MRKDDVRWTTEVEPRLLADTPRQSVLGDVVAAVVDRLDTPTEVLNKEHERLYPSCGGLMGQIIHDSLKAILSSHLLFVALMHNDSRSATRDSSSKFSTVSQSQS